MYAVYAREIINGGRVGVGGGGVACRVVNRLIVAIPFLDRFCFILFYCSTSAA